MNEREAYIALNLLSGIGGVKAAALVEAFGSAAEALTRKTGELRGVAGIGDALAAKIADWGAHIDLESELKMAARAGVEIISLADASYPGILREIPNPPLCLYCRGKLPDFDQPTLAIVGSRRVSSYGREMAKHLSESAAYAGWTVVSGLAYGIDYLAHRSCLDAKGTTVAVLGGGLARIHPQDHVPMAREMIVNGGAVISEFPLEFSPNRRSFPMRNRIVAGLSRGTLVVEAGFNSGSLITANFALEFGKQVFAVPGQADNPQARGCNSLIRQGAKLTENFEDIVEEFEFLPGFAVGEHIGNKRISGKNDLKSLNLSVVEEKIFALLKTEKSAGIDVLMSETGIAIGEILAALTRLETLKIIRRGGGGMYEMGN